MLLNIKKSDYKIHMDRGNTKRKEGRKEGKNERKKNIASRPFSILSPD
jgi:hypothetical protein